MKNKIIVANLIIFLLLPFLLISSNFYTNLYEEGKKLYLNGNYEEAVENFRIAEFGLMEDKKILKDLYLYYSLAHFKLNNSDEVIKISDKLRSLPGVSRFEDLKVPEEIKTDLDILFSAVDKNYKRTEVESSDKNRSKVKKKDRIHKENYTKIYNDVRGDLRSGDLSRVKSGLKKLKKIERKNIRTRHVSGIVYFRDNKYNKAVDELTLVSKVGPDELKNEASYYLALSNYFLKNYGQFFAYSQRVKDEETINKLSEILKKVGSIRKNGIREIRSNFFNKRSFRKFAESFNGDILLASDILKEVTKMDPVRTKDVYFMAGTIIGYSGIYNREFLLELTSFFSEKEQPEYSIDILKRSKYFESESVENIEILYSLGVLYRSTGSNKKMRSVMLRVKKIDPDYKKVNYYLTNKK